MNQVSNNALLSFALDLASAVTQANRFEQLVYAVRATINCDAVVLLIHHHGVLTPIAQRGLSEDLMGRRFTITEHPRLKEICAGHYPVRFPADSPLPDPYDGMVLGHDEHLRVHSCMGVPLYLSGKLIGVVTLDSITPNVFDDIDSRALEIIGTMAAMTLNTAMLMEQLETKSQRAEHALQAMSEQATSKNGHEMIGQSDVMKALQQAIQLVAPSDFAILIEGETGVGKELVARSLHHASHRSQSPMVYVNCAAIPQNLIESELFGHVKGAFTGADRDREGKFVLADGGTLFLDEIGELPLEVQGSLLRAIQNQEIQAVGKDEIRKVDVRIIAATNRRLEQEVAEHRFRSDLFHRLSVFPIQVPALKERSGDVPLLAGYFAESFRRKLGLQQLTLSAAAISLLEAYHWPGNVRELEHVISRAALFAKADAPTGITVITPQHLTGLQIDPAYKNQIQKQEIDSEPPQESFVEAIDLRAETERYQKDRIRRALEASGGNWSQAARYLSMDRANLARLAKRLGISVGKAIKS
ncbi:nitric oxide reductase transcriptional regulator NorR [Marinomonas pollencensis]|uniref:Anaerobic nitric oxide reductase transcription regulator n=1 Tax=Marinomonas pollencensis TaxID=491954 RepID=A0A3E0DM32_9GAMM|nr:nitric oxide reductase transcriptional regulator NorR [Marinomonas pollencensis]REG83821.1 anaerobic nitric oxide reductase transcription regulator [Marinomonas pollencensis]